MRACFDPSIKILVGVCTCHPIATTYITNYMYALPSRRAPVKVPQRILGPGAGPFLSHGTWDYGLF